jgi:hypothetical protein
MDRYLSIFMMQRGFRLQDKKKRNGVIKVELLLQQILKYYVFIPPYEG